MRRNTDKTGAAALAYLAFFIYAVSTGLLGAMLSALLADFGLGLIVCRFACSALSARLQPQSILRAGLLAATVLFSGGLLVGELWPAVCGGAAAGLFAGATIPLCITIGYGDHPHT